MGPLTSPCVHSFQCAQCARSFHRGEDRHEKKLGIGIFAGLTLFAFSVLPALAAQGTITEVNPSGIETTNNPDVAGNENSGNSNGAAEGANPAGV